MPAASHPRFDPQRLDDRAAQTLASLLREHRYDAMLRLPQRGGTRWFTEPLRIARFAAGGVNCWKTSPFPEIYRTWLARSAGEATSLLADFFFFHADVDEASIRRIMGDATVDALASATVIARTAHGWQSNVRVYPLRGMLFACDATRAEDDFVYLGWDSHLMVEVAQKYAAGRRFRRALDLCTGSGIQGLSLRAQADELVCADINPRALAMVRAIARLNGLAGVQTIRSDLFASIPGSFDCITANTPYVPELPDGDKLPIVGGELGIEFTLRLLREVPARLADDGIAIVYTSDPIVHGRRRLLESVHDVLRDDPMRTVLVPLFTNGYPRREALRHHYDRVGLRGYDDCILVMTRSRRHEVERLPWDAVHYYRTRVDAWVDWRRRASARIAAGR